MAVGSTFSDIVLKLELISPKTADLSVQFVIWTFDNKACRSSWFMTKTHVCSLNDLFRENDCVEPRDETKTTVMIIKLFQTFERSDSVWWMKNGHILGSCDSQPRQNRVEAQLLAQLLLLPTAVGSLVHWLLEQKQS